MATAALLLHAALAWLSRIPAITTRNDDALYVLLSRALRSGSYADLHLVGAPVHTQYPPGYPAMLALAGRLFGDSPDTYIAVGVVLSVVALGLMFDVARRLWSPGLALVVLVTAALNPQVIRYAGTLVAETPYMALSIAALWVLVALRPTTQQCLVGGALAIAAALTRVVGVSLIAAILLAWLFQRRFARASWLLVASAATVGGWLLWNVLAPDQVVGRSYGVDALQSHGPYAESGLAVTLVRRVSTNVPAYLTRGLAELLSPPTLAGTIWDNVLWVGLGLTFGSIGLWIFWHRWRLALIYLALYCAVIAVWPWQQARLVVPLQPLVLLAIIAGVYEIARRWGQRAGYAAVLAFSLPLVANSVAVDADVLNVARKCDREVATTSTNCFNADQLSYFTAARHAQENTSADVVFLAAKEATFAYYAHRRVAFASPALRVPPSQFVQYLRERGIGYVVLGRTANIEFDEMSQRLGESCGELALAGSFPPRTYLFRVSRTGESGVGRAACDAVARYRQDSTPRLPVR